MAQRIQDWGLIAPAIMLLEAHKPFSFIAGQALIVAEPLLSLFTDAGACREYAMLLEDRDSIEALLQQLEAV